MISEIFLEKQIKAIKDKILTDIKNLLEHEKEEQNYYRPVRVSNFWSNNYIDNKSNSDRNDKVSSDSSSKESNSDKTLSVKEYLNKISPYLEDIINNLKKSGTWTIQ